MKIITFYKKILKAQSLSFSDLFTDWKNIENCGSYAMRSRLGYCSKLKQYMCKTNKLNSITGSTPICFFAVFTLLKIITFYKKVHIPRNVIFSDFLRIETILKTAGSMWKNKVDVLKKHPVYERKNGSLAMYRYMLQNRDRVENFLQ